MNGDARAKRGVLADLGSLATPDAWRREVAGEPEKARPIQPIQAQPWKLVGRAHFLGEPGAPKKGLGPGCPGPEAGKKVFNLRMGLLSRVPRGVP